MSTFVAVFRLRWPVLSQKASLDHQNYPQVLPGRLGAIPAIPKLKGALSLGASAVPMDLNMGWALEMPRNPGA